MTSSEFSNLYGQTISQQQAAVWSVSADIRYELKAWGNIPALHPRIDVFYWHLERYYIDRIRLYKRTGEDYR